MNSNTRTITLASLPAELLDQIIGYLTPPAIALLRASSKQFRFLTQRHISKPPTLNDLVEAENWPYYDGLFTCSICLHLHPARKFADRMQVRRRRKGRKHAGSRFCVRCGVKTARYTPGNQIVVGGVPGGLCLYCGQFELRPDLQGRYLGINFYCSRCIQLGSWDASIFSPI